MKFLGQNNTNGASNNLYMIVTKMIPSKFQFKQFAMIQRDSGQRINTDSCAFGDLVEGNSPSRILDVGCGTGVLTLMMAQKYSAAQITGIEIDPNDATVAAENFVSSPWQNRLQVLNLRVQDFKQPNETKFDLILCNPPFFRSSTKSQDPARALARHDDQLPAGELAASIGRLLSPSGIAWLLCAADEEGRWLNAFCKVGLSLRNKISLADNPEALPHAIAISFVDENSPQVQSRRIDYRVASGGERSIWMAQHRARWFPF